MCPSIYLAGPDVFYPDARETGLRKTRICADYGLEGVFPLDVCVIDPDLPPAEQAMALYDEMETWLHKCDGLIANLTPFHGPSADVGTAFEMGVMRGAGKPVFAYSNTVTDFADRVVAFHGGRVHTLDDGSRATPDGMMVEDFGLTENLMLEGAVRRSGSLPAVAAEPVDQRHVSLASFELCVAEAAAHFGIAHSLHNNRKTALSR